MRRWLAAEEFRSMLVLAAPIAVLQTGMVFYGTVATVFAGRLGPEAIATVGLAGSTYFLLFIVALGILLGIDPLSSRAFGAGRHHECAEVLLHALALAYFRNDRKQEALDTQRQVLVRLPANLPAEARAPFEAQLKKFEAALPAKASEEK